MEKIIPIGHRVLLEPLEEKKTIGGLEVPETEKQESRKAKVVDLGSGIDKDGKKREFRVKKGDTVVYKKYAGEDFELDGKKLVVISEDDIIAVIQ
ncbi:co-chaperone GroES [Candidatus Dojkabacteria bacterium]|nr:co-chaperone GroES [Candidatus Dojkabacteria bacterium]